VAGYRLYFMDDEGHIQSAREFECSADHLAVQKAEGQADGRPMELWQQGRVVKRFAATPPEAWRREFGVIPRRTLSPGKKGLG
jgi:hypothetical protein